VSLDVRDLITLEDVMEEMELGPNGYVLLQGISSIEISGCGVCILLFIVCLGARGPTVEP